MLRALADRRQALMGKRGGIRSPGRNGWPKGGKREDVSHET